MPKTVGERNKSSTPLFPPILDPLILRLVEDVYPIPPFTTTTELISPKEFLEILNVAFAPVPETIVEETFV